MASPANNTIQVDGVAEEVSLKAFLLQAVLWLPLAFFLWFVLRTVAVYPVVRMVAAVLTGWLPDVFSGASQNFHTIDVDTLLPAPGQFDAEGRQGLITLTSNALQYAYGMPVLIGLVMATPMTWTRTFVQLAIGSAVLIPMQAFGVTTELLKIVAFDTGPDGAAALAANGVSPNALALAYQFGYLILPALTPIVLWILMNRPFIEALRIPPEDFEPNREPSPVTSVDVHAPLESTRNE